MASVSVKGLLHTFDPWHHLIVEDSPSSNHRRTFACNTNIMVLQTS